jgi:hypothetical protein
MSPLPRLLPLLAAILLAAGCQTSSPVPNDGRVTVTFDQPDKFTDVKSASNMGTDQGYLDALQRHIERNARRYLADGQRLTVRFTDIDMAGDIQPGRQRLGDVRVIRSVYPPRLKFSYAVTDAAGQIVSQGDENLSDPSFQSHTRSTTNGDPLFFEKALFNDWMAAKLRK